MTPLLLTRQALFTSVFFALVSTVLITQENPNTVVARLVSAAHGLSPSSGSEIARLLETVRSNPAPYVPLLVARLDSARLTADRDGEQTRQAQNAAAVLAQVGGDSGRTALVTQMAALLVASDRLKTELEARAGVLKQPRHPELIERARQRERLLAAQRGVLVAFGQVKDSRLRDLLLSRIRTESSTPQLWYLEYFEQTAPTDPIVKDRLTPMYDDPQSTLYRSPKVGALIGRTPPR